MKDRGAENLGNIPVFLAETENVRIKSVKTWEVVVGRSDTFVTVTSQ